jgi:hypothetical protein
VYPAEQLRTALTSHASTLAAGRPLPASALPKPLLAPTHVSALGYAVWSLRRSLIVRFFCKVNDPARCCAACGEVNCLVMCGCRRARYCSVRCREEHWAKHGAECSLGSGGGGGGD